MSDVAELLARYDAELRGRVPDPIPDGTVVERDGPVVRIAGWAGGGFVGYRDLGGLDGDELDALIARQVEYFRARDERFEWKTHGHDAPADLTDHLRAAGLDPEEIETVVIARLADIAGEVVLPEGVAIRELNERADLDRIARLEEHVWDDGEDMSFLADMLEEELTADPESIAIFAAEAGNEMVCAAWVRFQRGTSFGTFWGGGTLPAWRGKGIYRALVAHRARLALERGYELVEVDASDDSRPILERLGFVPVTTTTPWVWSPRRAALREHVERFNAGVRTGDFAPMLAAVADDAEMVFEGAPAGPFHGRDAIAAAYAAQPPDDEIVLLGTPHRVGDAIESDYAWKSAGMRAGRLGLTLRDGKIARLIVTFT